MYEIAMKAAYVLMFVCEIALILLVIKMVFLNFYGARHKILKVFYGIKGHKCKIGNAFVCDKCLKKIYVQPNSIHKVYNLDVQKYGEALYCPHCKAAYYSYDDTNVWKINK